MKNFFLVLFFLVTAAVPSHAAAKLDALDSAFRERRDEARGREALDGYRKLYAGEPKNVAAAWRFAMASVFVGSRYPKDDDEKKDLFAAGRDAARAAIEIEPNCAACEFWAGVSMALYGGAVGPFKTLFTLKEVRAHLNRVIELDPGYAYGGAYRVLGMIEWRLPGILGGDNDRAREYFKRAIAVSPDEPMNYVALAKLLLDAFDDEKGARQLAKLGLTFPTPPQDRVESVDAQDELRKLFTDLSPKLTSR